VGLEHVEVEVGVFARPELGAHVDVAVLDERPGGEQVMRLVAGVVRATEGVEPERGRVGGEQREPQRERASHALDRRARRRLLALDRLGAGGEHPYGGEVRAAQLAVQAAVLEHGAGVVAEREQHVVVELLEAARSVGAHHDAGEAVGGVDRDRDERLDLSVGSRALALGPPVSSARIVTLRSISSDAKRCASALSDGSASKPRWQIRSSLPSPPSSRRDSSSPFAAPDSSSASLSTSSRTASASSRPPWRRWS
jgi:hypothetical protein